MTFYRTQEMIKFNSSLNKQPLERVDQVKGLEFLYVPSLDFRPYIDFVDCK